MRFSKIKYTIAIALTVFLIDGALFPSLHDGYGVAEAKRYGGGSSFRSSGSSWGRSKPSRSSFKPFRPSKPKPAAKSRPAPRPTATRPAPRPSAASGPGHRPGTASGGTAPRPSAQSHRAQAPKGSARDQRRARVAAKQERVRQRQAKVDKARRENDALRRATTGKQYRPEQVRATREQYWEKQGGYVPDRYANSRMMSGDSYYGGFDNGFLTTMLVANAMGQDSGDAMLWYALSGSPTMALLMADAKEEAKGDPELEARIAAIEAQNAQFAAQGVAKPAVNQVLETMNVPPEVAFAPDALTGTADLPDPTLTIAAGHKDGNYYEWCVELKESVDGVIEVTCLETEGSNENLRKLTIGHVGAALAQTDAINQFLNKDGRARIGELQREVYGEYVFMIANKDGDVDSVGDLGRGNTLYVGPRESGSAVTWQGFVAQDRSYRNVPTEHTPHEEALRMVVADKNAVMLYVGALDSNFIEEVERKHGDELRLVAVNDGSLDNVKDREGNRVYSFHAVPGNQYPGLQAGAWWGTNDTETLTVSAVFALSDKWVAKYGVDVKDAIAAAVSFM